MASEAFGIILYGTQQFVFRFRFPVAQGKIDFAGDSLHGVGETIFVEIREPQRT